MPLTIAAPVHSGLTIRKSPCIGCVQPMTDRASAQQVVNDWKAQSQGPGSGPACVHDFSPGRLYQQQVALYPIPILPDSLPSPYLPGVTPITRLNMAIKALTLS